MNSKLVFHILGMILRVEAVLMHLVFSKGYLFFPAVRFYRLS